MWVRLRGGLWLVLGVLLLGGCTSSAGPVPGIAEHELERSAQPSRTNPEPAPGCAPVDPVLITDRLALIDAVARRLDDPACNVPVAERQPLGALCEAIWLATVLDPIELWLDGVTSDNRRRAAEIIDRAIAATLVDLESALPDEASALEALRVANDGVASVLNEHPLDEARLASLLIARGDHDIVEPLRALERACHQTS